MIKRFFVWLCLGGIAFSVLFFIHPSATYAGIFTVFSGVLNKKETVYPASDANSQTLPILQATRTASPELARGGGDITVVGGTALMPESGPMGTMADVEDSPAASETISTYVVRSGDSLQSIAKMFGVTTNTIIWANNITSTTIHEGEVLVILPIAGVEHTVKKGDTVDSIAKKYKADPYDIARYNNISLNETLAVGDQIIVPDGEIGTPVAISNGSKKVRGTGGPDYVGYYLRPILGGHKSQGLHGYNAVDLATYLGAPIFAAADGDVIISAHSGWNGGYGKYIVISHSNGTQTLYAHASENFVSVGNHVVRGQLIALVGSTGKSTGPHVHFEVRGAKNPF